MQDRQSDWVETVCVSRTLCQMENEWSVSVELVRQWRWRCLEEGILVPGSDLCVVNPRSGQLVRLAETRVNAVPRGELRHTCGGRVLPVTSLEDRH
jgi:hypothetical protein